MNDHVPLHVILAIIVGSAAAVAIAQPGKSRPADPDVPVACNLPTQFVPESLWNANLWPSGTVPYAIDAAVTQQNRDRLRAAMDELETIANIHFIPRTNQSNYLYVQNGGGNNSFVGIVGGAQTVNLQSWSFKYIICHELMHALGVWHEQQRADRGNFVTINYANIQSGYASNFDIRSSAAPYGPFDFESIMLYDDCSFSLCCAAGSTCNCPLNCATIQALPAYAQWQNLMGNRDYISQGDKDGLISRYGAANPCGCYANCDCSSSAPRLTANDFQCFLNSFANGASAANCDQSSSAPVLTANDFQCFLNAYSAGCS